jgi:CTP:molybdopterin cytidylyltransferase MocA
MFRVNNVDPIVVVTGFRSDELTEFLKPAGVRVAYNPDYAKGMFASVRVGVGSIDGECQGFFVMPVDIPLVRPWTIQQLLTVFAADPTRIVHPCFNRKRGHPPLIPAALVPAILHGPENGGLRGCLGRYAGLGRDVEVPDRHILLDIDTPQDYQRLLGASPRQDIPSATECDHMLRNHFALSHDILLHSRRVAEVADTLCAALMRAGENLNAHLVHAAAALHDIAKGHRSHARLADQWLRQMGFERVGSIVAAHNDAEPVTGLHVSEKQIVYLADKLVMKNRIVSIDERFDAALKAHGTNPRSCAHVALRRHAARQLAGRIEQLTGRALAELLPPDPSGDRRPENAS